MEKIDRKPSIRAKLMRNAPFITSALLFVGSAGTIGSLFAEDAISHPLQAIDRKAEETFSRKVSQTQVDQAQQEVIIFNQIREDFQQKEPDLLTTSMLAGESTMPIPQLSDSVKTNEAKAIVDAEQKRLANIRDLEATLRYQRADEKVIFPLLTGSSLFLAGAILLMFSPMIRQELIRRNNAESKKLSPSPR